MDEDKDKLAIEQCLAGNTGAFKMLVDKYEKVIFNVAYRMTSDYDASDDIAQAVFVKAFESLKSYDARFRFFSWLYRMAINESLNYLKQTRQKGELSPTLASNDKSPDESYMEAELHQKIQDALMALDPDSRVLLVLRHYGGCSYTELAEILGIQEKKVKSRLFTARHLLRDVLAKRGIISHDS
jgi:RNA polymerase sigma-70 factor (ECF subfamily)